MLDRFKNENLLCKITAEGLEIINLKTQKIYITSKIHKGNNLRRSDINSINWYVYEISGTSDAFRHFSLQRP